MLDKSSRIDPTYCTRLGKYYHCSVEEFLKSASAKRYMGKVQLIFTSPPFPLNRKKKYGNFSGDTFVDWLSGIGEKLIPLLSASGSIVIEMGNAWELGKPVMSTLALRSLLSFQEAGKLNLCQQFICYNPARLPSPAQWVNVDRIRVKDAYTHVWWLSLTDRPKANNRNVLKEYSDSMLRLIEKKKYNSGKRPSEHVIGKTSFFKNNMGAIPSNVLTFTNTVANDKYQEYCRSNGIQMHPARMPAGLAEFFIKFLTDKSDLIFDPFGGSNTTGAAAENLNRKWIACEPNIDYILGSEGRFNRLETT